mmetsp:Transcript_39167/g.123470  ORF Transcript_39167/g.123470 Transcript_39167/m.123470 type:complete len:140 (+) Transcript_39167:3133-3552(+)
MLHKRNMFETRLSDYRCHCSNCLLHACSPAPSHQLYPSLLPPSVFGFSAAFCLVYLKCLQAKHVKPSEPEAPLSAERGSEANPYEKPRHGPMRRRLEGCEGLVASPTLRLTHLSPLPLTVLVPLASSCPPLVAALLDLC